MKSKPSFIIALGGIISAMSFVLVFLSSLFPFGTYAFPCFAGMLIVVVLSELGYRASICVYVVVSVLSLLLVSDKEAALFYVSFLGFYPLVKTLIERLKNKVLQYVIKFLVFNFCIIAAFYIGIFLFGIPKESFNLFGIYLPWVFLILGNIFFIVYDKCVEVITVFYIRKLHPTISKMKK